MEGRVETIEVPRSVLTRRSFPVKRGRIELEDKVEEGKKNEGEEEEESRKKKRRSVSFTTEPDQVRTFEKDGKKNDLKNQYQNLNKNNVRDFSFGGVKKPDEIIEEEMSSDDEQQGPEKVLFSLHSMDNEYLTKVVVDTEKMGVNQLTAELEKRGLSTAGTKSDLIARLDEWITTKGNTFSDYHKKPETKKPERKKSKKSKTEEKKAKEKDETHEGSDEDKEEKKSDLLQIQEPLIATRPRVSPTKPGNKKQYKKRSK
eukprot:TRINITY_DN23085_c0_g1_i1.p1 TRINITY_DN23085_c0_g1~~TRINITY_DN23085_c0_g1_i1.p1  ORF type:complete len:258 (+),score=73.27 TRINITY_DN23085_c0_g1_i1:652-1425(+)